MTNFYDIYQDDFLKPSEENFDSLTHRINYAYHLLADISAARGSRKDFNPFFCYQTELQDDTLPLLGLNSKEALAKAMEAFQGCIRWHHPDSLFNLNLSPIFDTVALSTLTHLYNPNGAWDIASGKFSLIEMRVIRALAELAQWPTNAVSGFSTFGGKGTLIYAIKEGINRWDPTAVFAGLSGQWVVLASERCHFSLESSCSLLGIGKENCIRIKTDKEGLINLNHLGQMMNSCLEQKKKIACLILNGGSTINLSIDPVSSVRHLVTQIAKEWGVEIPHIHLDTVIGWVYMFFLDLDLKPILEETRDLCEKAALKKIQKNCHGLRQVIDADSFGVDFHKTGLCPYNSSFYVSKLSSTSSDTQPCYYGEARNFDKTIENSRDCSAIITAYFVLQRLGKQGFRNYVLHMLNSCEIFKQLINSKYHQVFSIINPYSCGYEIVLKIHLLGDKRSFEEICNSSEESINTFVRQSTDFYKFITLAPFGDQHQMPILGYIRRYSMDNSKAILPAFLIYPVSIHLNKDSIENTLDKLVFSIQEFERALLDSELQQTSTLDLNRDAPK